MQLVVTSISQCNIYLTLKIKTLPQQIYYIKPSKITTTTEQDGFFSFGFEQFEFWTGIGSTNQNLLISFTGSQTLFQQKRLIPNSMGGGGKKEFYNNIVCIYFFVYVFIKLLINAFNWKYFDKRVYYYIYLGIYINHPHL